MKIKKPTPAGAVLAGVILVLSLALVPAAFAGKGGGGNGGGGGGASTLSLVLSTDTSGNGVANWGDTVTYDVSTSATSAPQVRTSCSQNSAVVLTANASFYAGNPFAYMEYVPLQTGMWTSGAADCTAVMYYTSGKRTVTLKTLSFHVDA
jgi:hypothetical protein